MLIGLEAFCHDYQFAKPLEAGGKTAVIPPKANGAVIVYRSKRADRIKILVWDSSGLVLIWKQLQQGSFRWPPVMDGVVKLSSVEFTALFDGIDWTRVQTIQGIHKPIVAA
jgi:transposase